MEKGVVIKRGHKDFELMMGIISKEIETSGGCHHNHECFYEACVKLEGVMDYRIDKKKTLDYMEDNGGYCDCEILMNVWALGETP